MDTLRVVAKVDKLVGAMDGKMAVLLDGKMAALLVVLMVYLMDKMRV